MSLVKSVAHVLKRRRSGVTVGVLALTLTAMAPTASAVAAAPTWSLSGAHMQVQPTSGPAGTQIEGRAKGIRIFPMACSLSLYFEDAGGTTALLGSLPLETSFQTTATIPTTAQPGVGTVYVSERYSTPGVRCFFVSTMVSAAFTVTQAPRALPRTGTSTEPGRTANITTSVAPSSRSDGTVRNPEIDSRREEA
jgi:hypothetical protein